MTWIEWNKHPPHHKALIIIIGFITGNIVILNILLFSQMKLIENQEQRISAVSLMNPAKAEAANSCPEACMPLIAAAKTGAPTSTTPTQTVVSSGVKDFYVPLGLAQFYSTNNYSTIPGIQATVDTGNYGQIKSVTFEASVSTPNTNQDVSLQLYNSTGQHPVWFSQLFFPSGTTNNFMSAPITLDPGANTYQIQMQTQFQAPASLDVARIHITTY